MPAPPPAGSVRAIHRSAFDREPNDHYATPAWVTTALLRHVRLREAVWEPCCGTGAISHVLTAAGYDVVSSDIADYGFGTSGIDIFSANAMPDGCRSLVTNPPYGDATSGGVRLSATAMLDFVRHTLVLAEAVRGQVALLVRFQWIAGKRAAALLSSAPLDSVVALTQRIQWFDMGADTKPAQHHHCWIVFDYERPAATPPALLFSE